MIDDAVGTIAQSELPNNFKPMDGTYEEGHDNFGNYIESKSGVYVCFLYNPAYSSAFADAGDTKKAIFVAKYPGTNKEGIFFSDKDMRPVTTHSILNPVSDIKGCAKNRYDEMILAPKSIGTDFSLTPVKVYNMLLDIKKRTNIKTFESHNGKRNGVFFGLDFFEVALGLSANTTTLILKSNIKESNLDKDSAYDDSNYTKISKEKLKDIYPVLNIYQIDDKNMNTCLVGGTWGYCSLAGGFTLLLGNARSYSYLYVGGRASVFL